MSLLAKLQTKESSIETEEHILTVKSIRNAAPTKKGNLPRKMFFFEEMETPLFTLDSAVNGVLGTGSKCTVTLKESGEYINVVSIDAIDQEEWVSKVEFAAKAGATLTF